MKIENEWSALFVYLINKVCWVTTHGVWNVWIPYSLCIEYFIRIAQTNDVDKCTQQNDADVSDLTCFNRTKRFGKYTHQEAKIDTNTETNDPIK